MTTSAFTPETLREHPAFNEDWYHAIEFFPGLFTNGKPRRNLVVSRPMLAGCEIEGQRCLDIGAQDGLLSLLLHRRGAARVTATDRLDLVERIGLIRDFFDADIDYIGNEPIWRLPQVTRDLGLHPFDFVAFSGVLYHLLDPVSGLITVRSLVRDGGLVVMETAAVLEADPVMHFNSAGRYFPESNYWMMTLGCLDYLCRFLRMPILDCAYMRARTVEESPLDLVRVAIVCRATSEPIGVDGDSWISKWFQGIVQSDVIDYRSLGTEGRPPLAYQPTENEHRVTYRGSDYIDLFRTVEASPRAPRDENLMHLRLDDRI